MSATSRTNTLLHRLASFSLALMLGFSCVPSLARAEDPGRPQPSGELASTQVDQTDQIEATPEDQTQTAQVDQTQVTPVDQTQTVHVDQTHQDEPPTTLASQTDQDQAPVDQTDAAPASPTDPTSTAVQVQADQPTIAAQARIEDIGSAGNVTLMLTAKDIEATFAYGDILSVSFLGTELELPLGTSYSDVDTGKPLVRVNQAKGGVVLAINMGDFATSYGIAKKLDDGGTVTWVPAEGVSDPVDVTLTLHEAGGYYEEYVMRHLAYTDERDDYPDLTDDEFANFREVQTTGIRDGVLYRSASPVDPSRNRNSYADAALRRVGVASILNLADAEADLVAFPGYGDSYYATATHLAVPMGLDFQSPDFAQKLAQAMSFIANNPGPYDVHCLEGKDRTGYVVALLECLMGGSLDEVVGDYMVSFQNYFGVEPDERRYEVIANGNIVASLKKTFGTDDLGSIDLSKAAADYFASIGVSEDELAAVRRRLGPLPTYTVSFDMLGHGTAPEAQTVGEGALAVEPTAPTADGHTFQGWFVDRDCTKAYDYSSPVTSDLVLYAKWVAKEVPQESAKNSGGQAAKPATSTPKTSAKLPQTDDPWAAQPALAAALLGTSLLLVGAAHRARKRNAA